MSEKAKHTEWAYELVCESSMKLYKAIKRWFIWHFKGRNIRLFVNGRRVK